MDLNVVSYLSSPVIIVDVQGVILAASKSIAASEHLSAGADLTKNWMWQRGGLGQELEQLADNALGNDSYGIIHSEQDNELRYIRTVVISESPTLILIEFLVADGSEIPNAHSPQDLSDYSSNLLSLVDRDYNYLAVNEKYVSTWGRDRNQIEGHSVADILGKEAFTTIVREKLDQAFEGKSCEYVDWFYSESTNKQMLMKVSYSPVLDEINERVRAVAVTVTDLTDLEIKNTA